MVILLLVVMVWMVKDIAMEEKNLGWVPLPNNRPPYGSNPGLFFVPTLEGSDWPEGTVTLFVSCLALPCSQVISSQVSFRVTGYVQLHCGTYMRLWTHYPCESYEFERAQSLYNQIHRTPYPIDLLTMSVHFIPRTVVQLHSLPSLWQYIAQCTTLLTTIYRSCYWVCISKMFRSWLLISNYHTVLSKHSSILALVFGIIGNYLKHFLLLVGDQPAKMWNRFNQSSEIWIIHNMGHW